MSKFFINRPIVAMVIAIVTVIVGAVTIAGMPIAVYSPHGSYDAKFLANYAYINLVDSITRSPGIGQVQVFGAGQYAMRLWVKPDQLAKLAITVPEIVNAVQTQNTVNPAGKVGGEPIPSGQQFAYAVRAQGRLVSPEEFGEIVVRESPDGGVVRVKDVARIELGAQDYSIAGRLNGQPSAVVAVYQLPGSNAVDAAAGVKKLMAELKTRFPGDMDYAMALDTTRSVVQGIREIILTLVLAIGLVVDDAIVVVEAVERHIEEGMAPKAAALKAMEEISGPVVGIALVLSAVFVPTAFIPGITGRLYQQF